MKITGDVEVVNRDAALRGMTFKSRSTRSVLSIGNKSKQPSAQIKQDQPNYKSDLLLLVCTKSNPSGTHYKVTSLFSDDGDCL